MVPFGRFLNVFDFFVFFEKNEKDFLEKNMENVSG